MKADTPLATILSPSPNFGDRGGRPVDSLILHYTGMRDGEGARARLLDPATQVSCHYLVWEDGRIEQMVAEANRAWHAGRAFWAGERDMNSVSIGIEIVNGGHDYGCPPYPEAQIDAVITLSRDICARHAIVPARVLGHSDIAPSRKCDPGEYFPWETLARCGVGRWPEPADAHVLAEADRLAVLPKTVQERFSAFGYDCLVSEVFDEATACVVAAFQRHFRPARVDGVADGTTLSALLVLARS